MLFQRFTKWGFLTNWGWYSNAETELLALETQVVDYIIALDDFIEYSSDIYKEKLYGRVLAIMKNHSVKTSEIPTIKKELQTIQSRIKHFRIKMLNEGTHIPTSDKVFKNHQPSALVGEIRTFLGHKDRKKHFVIHYQADLRNHGAKNFHGIIDSGMKVNWALDVDGYLSIGDPVSTKHSVVAVGKDVVGAGVAQKKIDPREDMYLSMGEYLYKAESYDLEYERTKDRIYLETAKGFRSQVEAWKKELNGWMPKKNKSSTKIVVLDFDSGHYTPSGAWKKVALAWGKAGYKVEWSESSRRV